MKTKQSILQVIGVVLAVLVCLTPASARKLVSEARSVIQGIQSKSTSLSGELSEFHREFSQRAAQMVQLEALVEDMRRKGMLGKTYADSPEKYERVYAQYAMYMSDIKDIFTRSFPRIQNAVSAFNRSIYTGKDRIAELRSDEMSVVDTELGRIKLDFQALKENRLKLDQTCPDDGSAISRNCQRERVSYLRQLRRLKQDLARLQSMKKLATLKTSIVDKLSHIMDRYVYKEADTVDMMLNYAFNFEQYADFIGSKDLGGMLRTIRELGKLEGQMKDFEQFQKGLDLHVADMGTMVDSRLDHFMKETGIDEMESRGDVLRSFDDQEDEISAMIRELEQGA